MFRGRRRAPVLGAAVVIGASRSAARHEVASQTQAQQNAQLQANQAAQHAANQQQQAQQQVQEHMRREDEQRKREEDEAARRTQVAIDEAIARERARGEGEREKAGQQQQYGGMGQGYMGQFQQGQQQQYQVRNGGASGMGLEYAPPYSQFGEGDVKGEGGAGVVNAGLRYCGDCGNKCRSLDKFCNACGAKQMVDGA